MDFVAERVGDRLRIRLRGEVDHHNAAEVRSRIDRVLEAERPEGLLFNLREVSFCDSSGLGLVMGRLRKCDALGIEMKIEEPSEAVVKILRIAGMDKLLTTEKEKTDGKAS